MEMNRREGPEALIPSRPMKTYTELEMEVIEFDTEDILTASGDGDSTWQPIETVGG